MTEKKTFGGGTLCVECVTTEVSSDKGGNVILARKSQRGKTTWWSR